MEIVAHHVIAEPAVTDFEAFAERNPALLDKRLLNRHYASATVASPEARAGWVMPDLAAFPWTELRGPGSRTAGLAGPRIPPGRIVVVASSSATRSSSAWPAGRG